MSLRHNTGQLHTTSKARTPLPLGWMTLANARPMPGERRPTYTLHGKNGPTTPVKRRCHEPVSMTPSKTEVSQHAGVLKAMVSTAFGLFGRTTPTTPWAAKMVANVRNDISAAYRRTRASTWLTSQNLINVILDESADTLRAEAPTIRVSGDSIPAK